MRTHTYADTCMQRHSSFGSVKEALKRAWAKDTGETYANAQRGFVEAVDEGVCVDSRSLVIRSQKMGPACSDIISQALGWYEVEKLDIADNLLRDKGCEALSSVLSSSRTVTHINIASNDISPKGMAYILYALEEHARCETLVLGCDQYEANCNRLNSTVSKELTSVLKCNTTLRSLDLSRVICAKDLDIVDCISHGIRNHPSLQHLKLAYAGISGESASELFTKLCGSSALESIDLQGNEVNYRACGDLAAFLDDSQCRLTKLVLSDNPKIESGAVLLIEACCRSAVTHLVLSNTGIDDEVMSEASRYLEESERLQTLNVSHNNITEKGCVHIASALQSRSLTHLILSHNKLGDGAAQLAPALEANDVLQTLELDTCRVRDQSFIAIGVALINNGALHTLKASNNNISDNAGKGFAALLVKNRTLQKVVVKGNQLEHATVMLIRDILVKNKELKSNEEPQRLQKEVARLHYQKSKLHEANEELRECQQQRQKVAEILEAHEHEFRMSRDDAVKKIKELHNKIEKDRRELENVEASDRLKGEEVACYRARVDGEISELQQQLEEHQAKSAALQGEVEAAKQKLQDLEEGLASEANRLKQETAKKTEEAQDWQDKIVLYKQRLTELQNKVIAIETQEATKKQRKQSRSKSRS
eukprot:TRINITY_DN3758_c0_g1_i7.p1 TRINITY_DN3758_c0_g1~~TRINITY_DN3758_c0_g1_i7.p1  ORF type:complete len:651 (+),score=217.62 TRINITY_DN3758_c0_g1_i7:80-2032(+)